MTDGTTHHDPTQQSEPQVTDEQRECLHRAAIALARGFGMALNQLEVLLACDPASATKIITLIRERLASLTHEGN